VAGAVGEPSPEAVARLFELSLDMLGTASADGYFTQLNPAWERTLGWTNEELIAKPFLSFVHPEDVETTSEQIANLAQSDGAWDIGFENRYRTKDGDYRWIEWSGVAEAGVLYFVAKDVTDRKAAEVHRLAVEADRTQGVNVMRAMVESVAEGLYVCGSNGLLSFVNPAGVRLLGYTSAAELLGRSPHTAFHHSYADGTAYPIEDCPLPEVRVDGHAIHIEDDAFWRKDGSILPVSYSSAPMELSDGTGSVVAFRDISAQQAERERLRPHITEAVWFEEVRDAIAEDRLVLYGQPIIDLATGETVQHELLLRMVATTGQIIAPGLFLPAAEKYGLIGGIDRWVITQAAEMAAVGMPVTLNLSAGSVGSVDILTHIEHELTRTGAAPECLTLEVTETAVMTDMQAGRRFAGRLVALGCRFSLDDFGTGYGSLTYLRQLPIAFLKIDLQFVIDMVENEPDQKLVQAIVHIARSFGQKTVAEGVEDEETLSRLREFGVDFAQGYHLGRPQPFPDKSA
jgi:PAS domain S-box-containing protein